MLGVVLLVACGCSGRDQQARAPDANRAAWARSGRDRGEVQNPADLEPLRIAAASDLQAALPELADRFQARTGLATSLIFGASGLLAQQIKAGDCPSTFSWQPIERWCGSSSKAGSSRPIRLIPTARIAGPRRLSRSGHGRKQPQRPGAARGEEGSAREPRVRTLRQGREAGARGVLGSGRSYSRRSSSPRPCGRLWSMRSGATPRPPW